MTTEEMDAHAAYLDAFHTKLREDMIAEARNSRRRRTRSSGNG
jgi:hypothetical protein